MNEVKNPKVRKPLIYYYMMALLIMLLLNTFLFPALLGRKEVEVDYSTFTTQLAQGNIQQVEVLDQKIEYLLNDEEDNNIYITGNMGDPKLVDKLDAAKVIYGKEIEEPMSPFLYLLISVGGPILLFALLFHLPFSYNLLLYSPKSTKNPPQNLRRVLFSCLSRLLLPRRSRSHGRSHTGQPWR